MATNSVSENLRPPPNEPAQRPDDPRQRIQIDLSPAAQKLLQQMKQRSNASSNAEVVRNALRLYDWFQTQLQEGKKIRVKEPDGTEKEVEFVF
jgi:hypothetical protein